MTRKSRYERTGVHRVIETRVFKDFNKNQFLHDLAQQPWDSVNAESNPGDMWEIWKKLLMEIIDKHAPLKCKRASKRNFPWITYELSRKIHN